MAIFVIEASALTALALTEVVTNLALRPRWEDRPFRSGVRDARIRGTHAMRGAVEAWHETV